MADSDDDVNFLALSDDDEPKDYGAAQFERTQNGFRRENEDETLPGGNSPPYSKTQNAQHNRQNHIPEPKRRRIEDDIVHDETLDWFMRADLSMSKEELRRKEKLAKEAASLERLAQQIDNLRAAKMAQQRQDAPTHKVAQVYTVPPFERAWLSVTEPDSGDRYYLGEKLMPEEYWRTIGSKQMGFSGGKKSSLMGNFRDLMREAMMAKTALSESVPETIDEPPTRDDNNNTAELWVEKYKPQIYTDLLSDDSVNRTLLAWIKLWDECVFGIKVVPRQPNTLELKPKFSKFKQKYNLDPDQLGLELDNTKRPKHKLILLCGPPGLGKTTLAQIIARQAGYNTIELNASDDRTLQVFKDRIESAIQASRTVDSCKPNCLIIDEIDGAPTPSINFLLSLVKDTNKKKRVLKRPIICICNDLYATSLRELRKTALVVQFPNTNANRLSDRLNHICRQERVRADAQALDALCEKSTQDVRACLNTLQFVAQKNATVSSNTYSIRHVTLLDVKTSSLGVKDSHQTLFDVWRKIFELPRANSRKRHLLAEKADKGNHLNLAARFSAIANAVIGSGETEKLRQGIFENYLNCKADVQHANMGMEWFSLVDRTSTLINRTQCYQLMRYPTYLAVVFHFLYASGNYMKLQYPRMQYEMSQRSQRSKETVESVLDSTESDGSGAKPRIRAYADANVMAEDILPYLCAILQPNMRPVNFQLYSASEKAELQRVISAMLEYNLSYKQARNPDGQYVFHLEPPIEDVVCYPEMQQKYTLPYSAKQLISREVELERVRHADPIEKKKVTKVAPKPAPAAPKTRKTPIIFGAKKEKSMELQDSEASIWFKFAEGSVNAVKRTIRMADLL